jgi:hypothetical protein
MKRALRWTAKTKQRLVEVIRRGLYLKSGATCIFVPLFRDVGLKIYSDKFTRDHCVKMQGLAAKHKLAPQVGDKFELECLTIDHFVFTDDGTDMLKEQCVKVNTVYGYVTERARLVRRYSQLYMDVWTQIIADELEDLGIVHPDLWVGNVGYIGGRLVCIDFDTNSCRRKPGRPRKVQGCEQIQNGC